MHPRPRDAPLGERRGHAFNYDFINGPDAQISSVWRIPAVTKREKRHGYHPTQKPLRLVRRSLLASTREGDLVFDPFTGSGTTGVAAKELNRFFVGTEPETEFCELAGRRIGAAARGSVLRGIPCPAPGTPVVELGAEGRVVRPRQGRLCLNAPLGAASPGESTS